MMPTEDYEEYDILPHLLEAIAFLSRAESSGGCAFVHCNYGVNRSGVVAAAYLMVSERKPLLQLINELKARRSLILSNVGFRRQLVRFARCRGLLDHVERPSRCSPRLEPGEKSPRGATPSKDKITDETKDESTTPQTAENGSATETSEKNGEVPPRIGEIPSRNGYSVTPTVLAISTDPILNGVQSNGALRLLRPTTSRREQLLRDIDSTIGTLSFRDGVDTSSTYVTYHRPRDDIDRLPSPSIPLYDQPRSSAYLPAVDYTSDPVSSVPLSSHFNVLDHRHSSDSDDDFAASPLAGFYSRAQPSNSILEEYLQYKRAAIPHKLVVPAAEPLISTIKPRSSYSRSPATASSVLNDYDEADMSSFLAVRNARRPLPLSQRRLDHAVTSVDLRRRSTSSPDAILGQHRSYSAGKTSASMGAGYKTTPAVGFLSPSAYRGRWHAGPTVAPSRYVTGMTSGADDSFGGDGMRSVGRTVATRVTPAPGHGPRSSYARSHSVSRLL